MSDVIVDSLVKSTLELADVPVSRIKYSGSETTYIVYQRILGQEAAHADDDNTAYEHYYRASIYTKSSYFDLLAKVMKSLKAAGFYSISVNAEIYENNTGFHHVSIDFNYMEECE